ncbi:MAG TPA: MFS transporter [Ktedonobacteraceae bacterium]
MERAIPNAEPALATRVSISRRGRGVIAMLFILGAISFTDKSITGYLSVPLIKEFHLSSIQWGILSGSSFWLFSLSSLLIGAWSDRVGTTRVLSLLAVCWTIVQAATGFVTSFPLLLLSRVALGMGEGPYTSISLTAVAKWLPYERRGLGFALVSCGNLAGPAILTPFLIICASAYGWRAVFLLLGLCSLLWLVAWMFVGREGPQHKEPIVEVALAPSSRQRESWAAVLPPLFSRNILLITLATFAAYWMQALSLSWLSVYLMNVRHLPFTLAAALSSVVILSTCLVQVLLSLLADRWFRHTGTLRPYVSVLSMVLVFTAALNYSAMLVAPLFLSILCLCIQPNGTVFPLAGTLITHIAPAERRGTIQGASIAIATIGSILGPTLAGLLLQSAGKNLAQGFQILYLISAVFLAVVSLTIFLFVRLKKGS